MYRIVLRVEVYQLSVSSWDDACLLRTTDAITFLSSQLHVAFITPSGAPGVSDEPDIFVPVFTVPDHGDDVVEISSASVGVKDT